MSIQFRQGKLQGQERTSIIQEVQQDIKAAILTALKPLITAILEKYRRFWLDVDQQVLFGSGLCQSLRHLSQYWSATLESSVGLRTLVSSHQSD